MLERIWLNCQSIALSQGCRNRALRWHPAPPAMPHWGRSDGIRSNDGMRNQANELRGACRVNPPGSSRRAGGSLPVLRLAAPRRAGVVPCPKKITLWDIVLTSERRFWGARRADGSRAVFLLVACCTQEEDAAGAPKRQLADRCAARESHPFIR